MKLALLGAVFALAGCAHADRAQLADGAVAVGDLGRGCAGVGSKISHEVLDEEYELLVYRGGHP